MSTIYKRKDSPYWWWNTDHNGRRFSKSTKQTNKSLAKKITQHWDMNLMLGDLSFLGLSSNSNQQIETYINDYLLFLSKRVKSVKSLKTSKSHLSKFCDTMSQARIKLLSEVSVRNINQYLDRLEVSAKTKKNHLQSISSMMNQAMKEGVLKSNPCKLATLPKIIKNNNVHRLLKPIDLEIIFESESEFKRYFLFLYHTGLRANDVACLKYGDIDFRKKSIVRLIRKSKRVHEFPIADVLIKSLNMDKNSYEPIFPSLYNDSEQNDKLCKPRKYMQELLKAKGRPHADLHSFRHTFNQSLFELGMDIEDRQKLLAHASTTATKIYTHPNFDLAMQYVNQVPYYGVKRSNNVVN